LEVSLHSTRTRNPHTNIRITRPVADLFLLSMYSMGGREASLEAQAKSAISDAKEGAKSVAAQAETVAADAKAKGGEVVEKIKGKLS
jgi:hypothetical protein